MELCNNLYDSPVWQIILNATEYTGGAGRAWRTSEGHGWVTLDMGSDVTISLITIRNSLNGMKNV